MLPDRYATLTQPLSEYLALVRASSFPVVGYSQHARRSSMDHHHHHLHYHSGGGGGGSRGGSSGDSGGGSSGGSSGGSTRSSHRSPPPPLFCHRSTTFADAVRLLCDGRLHHVFVAEDCGGDAAVADTAMAGRATGKLAVEDLVGVLTLTDVLRRVCFDEEFFDVEEDFGVDVYDEDDDDLSDEY